MVKAAITIQGAGKHVAALRRLSERAGEAVYDHVVRVAVTTHDRAVNGLHSGPASGRVYQKYNPRRRHRASAAGEYPASDTGRLASSVGFELPTSEKAPVARVGTAVRYGAYLEGKATARGGRKWLSRALSEAAIQLKDDLEKRMK